LHICINQGGQEQGGQNQGNQDNHANSLPGFQRHCEMSFVALRPLNLEVSLEDGYAKIDKTVLLYRLRTDQVIINIEDIGV